MLLFQVKMVHLYNVRGVATQGRHDSNQWVKSFSLAYTADDFNWVYIRENSQVKVRRKRSRNDNLHLIPLVFILFYDVD